MLLFSKNKTLKHFIKTGIFNYRPVSIGMIVFEKIVTPIGTNFLQIYSALEKYPEAKAVVVGRCEGTTAEWMSMT